jgi:hypothetical protein
MSDEQEKQSLVTPVVEYGVRETAKFSAIWGSTAEGTATIRSALLAAEVVAQKLAARAGLSGATAAAATALGAAAAAPELGAIVVGTGVVISTTATVMMVKDSVDYAMDYYEENYGETSQEQLIADRINDNLKSQAMVQSEVVNEESLVR